MKVAAGIIVYRMSESEKGGDQNRIEFLLLRNARRSEWGFPKGHADITDSDILATAHRELEEETGLRDVLLHTSYRSRIEYALPSGETKVVTYFLAMYHGGETRLSPEHDDYKWAITTQALALLTHETLRRVLENAVGFLGRQSLTSHLL